MAHVANQKAGTRGRGTVRSGEGSVSSNCCVLRAPPLPNYCQHYELFNRVISVMRGTEPNSARSDQSTGPICHQTARSFSSAGVVRITALSCLASLCTLCLNSYFLSKVFIFNCVHLLVLIMRLLTERTGIDGIRLMEIPLGLC